MSEANPPQTTGAVLDALLNVSAYGVVRTELMTLSLTMTLIVLRLRTTSTILASAVFAIFRIMLSMVILMCPGFWAFVAGLCIPV